MKRASASFIIGTFVWALLWTILPVGFLTPVAQSKTKENQPAKPFTIDDLIKTRRVGEPQISPDGRLIAYTITDTDKEANRRTPQIYVISVDGGEVRQL